jgi:hypothetical protein
VTRDGARPQISVYVENVMGIAQIATGAIDFVVRNLRVAGRPDVTRLARQIARTEDKLELVLQEVERLGERIDALQPPARSTGANGGATSRRRKTSA